MCRWLAYLGSDIPIEDVLIRPDHSLLDQSLLARDRFVPGSYLGSQFRDHAFPTNGDGFGLAWRGRDGTLGQFRQTTPAWDSQNLRHLAAQLTSGCFLSHVRAAPGGTIAEQNCHPFVHGNWMFQHNGEINGFTQVKRDLTMDVDPDLYPFILGNSDTEVCFHLALTYGLADDPVAALTRMIGRVEQARHDHKVAEPFRATMCASDGTRLIILRWISPDATGDAAPSLFHSFGARSLRTVDGTPDNLPIDSHLVVSEPLELHWSERTWHEIPAGTIGTVTPGTELEMMPIQL
ncbi:glutamine amidotransferase [Branchiibius hedensis]|uniref:Glutamine amidotransferase n=1 Tax=Branchiibius hedensis TaxID=672460 RepID=A0A2Y8ZK69_9MICO|nr:class II glutamine amidotransferase [Branchiibius hedensis]PWJ23962.1 glutamine amidotransferase [Branchiibius hedensis]SSA32780.1 glutamine amidotransferase [Branchiibius hedensis]